MEVDRALVLLSEIMERTSPATGTYRSAKEARRALDGEGGEEVWVAVTTVWTFEWAVRTTGGRLVAERLDKATARRIADDHNRIGKLERAITDYLKIDPPLLFNATKFFAARDALAAALKQEGQP